MQATTTHRLHRIQRPDCRAFFHRRLERVRTDCGLALSIADEIDRDPERAEARTEFVKQRVGLLRDVAALSVSEREDEQKIGRIVREWVAKVRSGEIGRDVARQHVLAAWDQAGG